MATTTNYAWETPDDTDLVKDGAAAIRTLGSSIDTTTKALNPSTTLGDLEYRSSTANTNTRLGIGTTGQVLTVSAGVPAWATPTSSTGPAFRAFRSTSNQSIGSTTATKVQLNGETFDTNNCFDSTTNYRFTPTTAGYYLITGMIGIISGSSGYGAAFIYKNGSRVAAARTPIYETNSKMPQVSDIIYFNGSSDYVELYVLNNGATASVEGSTDETWFAGSFIKS